MLNASNRSFDVVEKSSSRVKLDRPLLFLIGYRGTGKTTVARALAVQLGWQWIDADDVLERRHGRSIRSIFESEGEIGFRDKEEAILGGLCRLKDHIIATGGGVVLRPGNRELLTKYGRVVWLTADVATLWQRMQGDVRTADRRPNLTVGGIEEIVEILPARAAHYGSCADLTVSTEGRVPEQIAAEIVQGLSRFTGADPEPAGGSSTSW